MQLSLCIIGPAESPELTTVSSVKSRVSNQKVKLNPECSSQEDIWSTARYQSNEKGKQTLKENADKEESTPAALTEKKGKSALYLVKADKYDNATCSEKPTGKGQNTPAASEEKASCKICYWATLSKPNEVLMSKKALSMLTRIC
ncbi:hypothetical protein KCU81_g4295, partial [Aureobasidium melanogenum]|uniref:Uncharacterized protein n=1 Tax=Aureobasidium melanogenum (strain CBS 110374) TaxID=1043003 RepID=A0A074VG40_AURM1